MPTATKNQHRDYQVESVQDIYQEWNNGRSSVILVVF